MDTKCDGFVSVKYTLKLLIMYRYQNLILYIQPIIPILTFLNLINNSSVH